MSPTQLESTPWLAGIYAASIYAFMLLLAHYLIEFKPINAALTRSSNRYGALDGLRGILASGVLIHHSHAAYVYFTTGVWDWSSSAILNHLGQTTVALFFMITGFLFTIKASEPRIDWSSLYISRLARLAPLYWLVVAVVFGLAIWASDGLIKEPLWVLIKELLQWMAFVCFGRPDINGLPMTWTILAGVNWSLKYEVLFYVLAIPAVHFSSKHTSITTSFVIMLGLLTSVLGYRYMHPTGGESSLYVAHFLGGMLVARAFAMPKLKAAISTLAFKGMAIAALCTLLTMPHARSALAVITTTVIFASVVGGASLFGVLQTRAAIWLGDISYGIYLIHGVVLWTSLTLISRAISINSLPLPTYWAVALAVSAVATLLASLSYVQLEKPAMAYWSARSRMARNQAIKLKA